MFGLLSRLSSLFTGETQMDEQHEELPTIDGEAVYKQPPLFQALEEHTSRLPFDDEELVAFLDNTDDGEETWTIARHLEDITVKGQTEGRIQIPQDVREEHGIETKATRLMNIAPIGGTGLRIAMEFEGYVGHDGRVVVPKDIRETIGYEVGGLYHVGLFEPIEEGCISDFVDVIEE